MKNIISAMVLAMAASSCANAQTDEQLVGALLGSGLGYAYGDGSGNQKEIAAAGAIGGWLLGTRASSTSGGVFGIPNSYNRVCAHQVPPQYEYNRGARNAWIQGCSNRVMMQQRQFEQDAYEAGIQ